VLFNPFWAKISQAAHWHLFSIKYWNDRIFKDVCPYIPINVYLPPKHIVMHKIKFVLPLILIMCAQFPMMAQTYHFGVRAGLNYSRFNGPFETDVIEKFDYNNGFHFGATGMMTFNEYFSLGAEILYNQYGTKYYYEGPSYYVFNLDNVKFLKNDVKLNLNISNSYINIPILVYFRPFKKFELMAGGYMGFLINPIGSGRLDFGGKFYQSLEYNYYKDEAGAQVLYSGLISVKVPQPDGEDEVVNLYKIVGAYYQYDETQFNDKTGTAFNWFDVGLTGGFQYFINKSLYAGFRAEMGLLDITNNNLDRSLKEINSDGTFILRQDIDKNINFQISLGFRF